MPKFTLIAEHEDLYGNQISKVTHEFNVDYIGDVLENVDLFLRGVGFNPTGTLDYFDEELNEDEYYEQWANATYEHDLYPLDHEERCGK